MNNSKKSVGFYLLVLAALLSLVSVIVYRNVLITVTPANVTMIIATVLSVVAVVLSFVVGNKKIFNWVAIVGAMLMTYALVIGLNPMLDPIGYVVSGLYEFAQIKSYIVYVVFAVVTMLFYIIAGFTKFAKED